VRRKAWGGVPDRKVREGLSHAKMKGETGALESIRGKGVPNRKVREGPSHAKMQGETGAQKSMGGGSNQ
jgi:hypothetical protein